MILSRPYEISQKLLHGGDPIQTLFEFCISNEKPDLLRQWHPTRNGELTPENTTPYSNRKVWWLCDAGHEYQATVAHRTRIGSGCPYCVNFKPLSGFNDLATKRPDIAAQWHEEFNGDLTPAQVTPGSHKKVWWKCGVGHSWQACVYSRTSKRAHGCPVCAGKVNEDH